MVDTVIKCPSLCRLFQQCLQVAAGGGKGSLARDLAVVASCLLTWAVAPSRQGSQHYQMMYADIRKSSLAECTDFTPLVAALAEGRTVRCHECALKLEPAGSSKTLVKAYQTTRPHAKERSQFNYNYVCYLSVLLSAICKRLYYCMLFAIFCVFTFVYFHTRRVLHWLVGFYGMLVSCVVRWLCAVSDYCEIFHCYEWELLCCYLA
jgi:hypothetical protein